MMISEIAKKLREIADELDKQAYMPKFKCGNCQGMNTTIIKRETVFEGTRNIVRCSDCGYETVHWD